MRCPVCRQPMVVVEREGIEVDWCLACRGLWFDQGELELLAEKSGRGLRTLDVGQRLQLTGQTRPRACPRCRRKMQQAQAGSERPVIIDRCPQHGLFLDSGELGTIMRQLEPTGSSDEAVIIRFLGETFRAGDVGTPES